MNQTIYIVLLTIIAFSSQASNTKKKKPNILFIAIDDLRTELGCYGAKQVQSPNIDKLANEGIQFNRAYCQQAICGPSRASIMTGLRPLTSGVTHNYIRFREQNPEVVTIPQYFMQQGYNTSYYGKIFHHGDEDPVSWNVDQLKHHPYGAPAPLGFHLPENIKIKQETKKEMIKKYGPVAKYGLFSGPAYESADVPDNAYADGYNTDMAIEALKQLSKKGKPFFLGLGMHKPHLNWTAPKKYWDLYNENDLELTTDSVRPKNSATMGLHASFELRVRSGIPKKDKLDSILSKKLKHAYFSCVSYVDAQIGRIIEALEEEGVRNNTIIVLWSDHGWHLGEKGIWGKATNFELATRVPFIIWTPEISKENAGTKSNALVELIDIYPTLSELAGLEKPTQYDGKSLVPLLDNPTKKWIQPVLSQFPTPALREWGAFPLRPAMRETYFGPLIEEVEAGIKKQQGKKWNRELFENYLMGYSMRTDRYRFILWKDDRKINSKALYYELYDHKKDPLETINIAKKHPKLVKQLERTLNTTFLTSK